ncbi:MAG: DUF1570 domain-containing protein [Planctomycetota bacterium]|nr:DUF1570 domain-containing protein [Planctomycetota bacterium]
MKPFAAIFCVLAATFAASAFVSPRAFVRTIAAEDADETVTRARTKLQERDFQGAVDILQDRLRRQAGDVSAHELLGSALLGLSRNDEAAHHLEIALRRAKLDGKEDRAKVLLPLLMRADALYSKRAQYFERVVDTLCDSAEELNKKGHGERALELVERLPTAVMPGKAAVRVEELLAELRAQFSEVRLDEAATDAPTAGELPLVEYESDHYRFACHLELDVVKRLGTVMDDIHAFYVQVYFDGEAKKAGGGKPTIRVHVDKKSMLKDWAGGSAPEGWWSPGSNEVVTFDTRNTGSERRGSLDNMLVTLFHEASHQFMTLLSKGGFTPAWLNEGTASFFEGTTAMADGRVLWPAAALGRLRNLVTSLSGGSPTARQTIEYEAPGSYGGEYYAFGWGLCYFMQEYEDATTLEYVFRPLYAEYRSRVIQKGGDPMGIFESVFLGKKSPLGHKTFEDFERDWKAWIVGVIDPLNRGDDAARVLRMKRVDRYLAAAEAVKAGGKSKVSETDLLSRALGHIEYVRAKIDGEAKPRGDLLLLQADLLERLKRTAATAPLLEKVLELADSGRFTLDAARYDAIEKRLASLDQKNAALRSTKSKVAGLARAGAALLVEYRAAKPSLLLRSYTFAAFAGGVLKDDAGLLVAADELRNQARDARLLLGTIVELGTNPKRWSTIVTSPPTAFASENHVTFLESVRTAAYIDLDVPISGEYAWRARVQRTKGVEFGSVMGAVVAGNPEGDWQMIGLDENGAVGAWTLVRTGNGGTVLKRTLTLYPKNSIDLEKPLDFDIHVRRDRKIVITIGSEKFETALALDPNVARHVGVFTKNNSVRFENASVEIFP